MPSLTLHKPLCSETHSDPIVILLCSNTSPALKGRLMVCFVLLFYLSINWSHLWIVYLLKVFFVSLFLLRTPEQAWISGCKERKVWCMAESTLFHQNLSAGCLQGVLLASCWQHQLFFSVIPWPDNNIPAGHLIALLGHGLYYACLMDN